MKIGHLGIGKIFGEKDAISKKPYSTTIKCHSTTASCLRIERDKLIKVLGEVDEDIITEIKAETEDNSSGLTRYLDKNKEFESNSKFMNKFKEFSTKLINEE